MATIYYHLNCPNSKDPDHSLVEYEGDVRAQPKFKQIGTWLSCTECGKLVLPDALVPTYPELAGPDNVFFSFLVGDDQVSEIIELAVDRYA